MSQKTARDLDNTNDEGACTLSGKEVDYIALPIYAENIARNRVRNAIANRKELEDMPVKAMNELVDRVVKETLDVAATAAFYCRIEGSGGLVLYDNRPNLETGVWSLQRIGKYE